MPAAALADYRTLADAFAYLNAELFDGQLPPVLITLQRTPNALGYYDHEAFADRIAPGQPAGAGAYISESLSRSEGALNPNAFARAALTPRSSRRSHTKCATCGSSTSGSLRAAATTTPSGRARWRRSSWSQARRREAGDDWPEDVSHDPAWRAVRPGCRPVPHREPTAVPVARRERRGEREGEEKAREQDEIYLPVLRTECLGEGGRLVDVCAVHGADAAIVAGGDAGC